MDHEEAMFRYVTDEPAGALESLDRLPAPVQDLAEILEALGRKLFPHERPLVQYVAWAREAGLFDVLSERGGASLDEVCARTRLNEAGADALVGVLCALRLVARGRDGSYLITAGARDYFLSTSPFFIGNELYAPRGSILRAYVARRTPLHDRVLLKLLLLLPKYRFGTSRRLANQHARNLPACVAAARTSEFARVRRLVDVAGGSGAFAIPLALEHPHVGIVLADLPAAVKNVRPFLARHGLERRIELLGIDLFESPWKMPECDGMFIGNFLHGFDDETCLRMCRRAFERLISGGKIWLHEMIWNDNKDGPLITSLWNAAMRAAGGKQRTSGELMAILAQAGFVSPYVVRTATAFALVAAEKP